MYSEERRRQIASLTAVEGRVNVTELAARFDVTAETIRRDLAVLDREGVVHRVHGGAVANQTFQTTEQCGCTSSLRIGSKKLHCTCRPAIPPRSPRRRHISRRRHNHRGLRRAHHDAARRKTVVDRDQ